MKILIAEDDPSFRRLLKEKLATWGYEVTAARDGSEAWQVLQGEDAPRLAILDWMMPGMDGLELCRKVRQEVHEPYLYLILLTAHGQDEDLVAGMEAGADDYIAKPFKHHELRVRLRAGRRIIELQNQLIETREMLKAKSVRDSLTGLFNHEEILRLLGQEVARAGREGTRVAVAMADLDHFKGINDTFGHLAGDTVLRLTGKRLLALKRPYDAVGRYGGEEFLAVLTDCGRDSAMAFAERLRSSISGVGMDTPEGTIPVTVSVGVAVSGRQGGLDAESLVRNADQALFRAKANGRNRVEVAPDEN